MLRDPQPELAGPAAALPAFVRAQGVVAARFARTGRGTKAMNLREAGGYRLKFPKAAGCQASINHPRDSTFPCRLFTSAVRLARRIRTPPKPRVL